MALHFLQSVETLWGNGLGVNVATLQGCLTAKDDGSYSEYTSGTDPRRCNMTLLSMIQHRILLRSRSMLI